MPARDSTPGTRSLPATILAIAATYAYFLLFAQFGFLSALQFAASGEQAVIKPVLAVMGTAGIFGSILAARTFSPARGPRNLMLGFTGAAIAAAAVGVGVDKNYFYPIAAMIGLGLGVITVTLAGLVRAAAGTHRLGATIGLGTGAAYACCNWPTIFSAAPSIQAWISSIIAVSGAFGASQMKAQAETCDEAGFDYSRGGITWWTLLFFALVCLDSGAFYLIQHTPQLKAATWAGERHLETIAFIHFIAAVLAGLAFDRRWPSGAIPLAATLLVAACAIIPFDSRWAEGGAWLYATAVSMYSVALVFYACRSPRPSIAAVVYAIAGWGGSAAGVSFVQTRPELLPWFVGVAGVFLGVLLLLRSVLVRK